MVFSGRMVFAFVLTLSSWNTIEGRAADHEQWFKVLREVKSGETDVGQAVQAAKQLQALSGDQLLTVLKEMKNSSPLGRNWLAGVANTLHAKSQGKLREDIERFLADKSQDAEARYLAFGWLTESNQDLRRRMLDSMLDDPSQEIRHAAVEHALQGVKDAKLEGKQLEDRLTVILDAARHPDQIVSIVKQLKETGKEIPQAQHFGFLSKWEVIAPFDNVGQKAFNTEYPIEKDLLEGKFDRKKTYEGKGGNLSWLDASGDAMEGLVDLNPIFKNEKGAIAYARTEFHVQRDTPCQFRLGCINANKLWLNGKLLLSNEVYHASMQIDQYVGDAVLKAGKNEIVLKVCQNEQTEQWAQKWVFQLRICDASGKAIRESK